MDLSLDRDHPYFEGSVPIRVLSSPSLGRGLPAADTAAKSVELTVRLLSGSDAKGSSLRQRVLHLEISDDKDPFFLHSLTVGETEFVDLAAEQSILVDFAAFPAKLVELLEACVAHKHEATPKFSASLLVRDPAPGGSSSLSLVETNAFKQITHLALMARVGTDAALKRHLAGRLQQTQACLARTSDALESVRGEASSLREQNASLRAEVASLRGEAETREGAARVRHEAQLLQVRRDADAAARAADAAHSAALSELRGLLEGRLADAAASAEDARSRISALQAEKAGLEGTLRETQTALAAATSQLEAANASLGRLRESSAAVDSERLSVARELTAAQLRVAVLETSLREKESTAARAQEALSAAESGRGSSEEALALYRATVAKQQSKLETCVAEINKGNALIGRLQEEYRALKAQLKAQREANRALEASAHEAAGASESLQREAASLRADASRERSSREATEAACESLRQQLAEAKEALSHNQQVIAWLNRELTDTQAAASGHAPLAASMGAHGSHLRGFGGGAFASPTVSSRMGQSAGLPATFGASAGSLLFSQMGGGSAVGAAGSAGFRSTFSSSSADPRPGSAYASPAAARSPLPSPPEATAATAHTPSHDNTEADRGIHGQAPSSAGAHSTSLHTSALSDSALSSSTTSVPGPALHTSGARIVGGSPDAIPSSAGGAGKPATRLGSASSVSPHSPAPAVRGSPSSASKELNPYLQHLHFTASAPSAGSGASPRKHEAGAQLLGSPQPPPPSSLAASRSPPSAGAKASPLSRTGTGAAGARGGPAPIASLLS